MRNAMDEAMAFLDARGLDPELASAMGWTGKVGKQGGVGVAIPYVRGGKLLGHKYRAIGDKRFFADKGWERDLWNVDRLTDPTLAGQPAVITEGEMDALACIQAGWQKSVSIPDGWTENYTAGEGAKAAPMIRNEAALRKDPVIVAADNDPTGHSFLRFVANLLEDHDVRWAKWPEDCKDANDVLRIHGEGKLSECLHAARPIDPPGGIITAVSDLPPRPPRRLLRTGVGNVDKIAAFEIGALSVLTGIPGQGKSTLATWLAHRIVKHEGIRAGLLMMETHPERTRAQLVLNETGNQLAWHKPEKQVEILKGLDQHWRIVQRTDEGDHHLGWLKDVIRALAVREGCKLVVIDPWNELEHYPEPGESLTQYLNVALTRIRQWAEKYDCHVLMIAHPRKMHVSDGKPTAPVGYDIADSAAWVNKPSLGLTVHPDDEHVKLLNWKIRDREYYGIRSGFTLLEFDPAKLCYREAR